MITNKTPTMIVARGVVAAGGKSGNFGEGGGEVEYGTEKAEGASVGWGSWKCVRVRGSQSARFEDMCAVGTYVLTYGLACPESAPVTRVLAHVSVLQTNFDAQQGPCTGWSRKVLFGRQN